MDHKITDRIINRFGDKLEDLRLENKITRDQEEFIWKNFDEIVLTAKYNNPFKVKDYEESRKEQSQPVKSEFEEESISDLIEYCVKLGRSISLFILKLKDKEETLKRMNLLTENEKVIRKAILKRTKKQKLNLFRLNSLLNNQIKNLESGQVSV